MRRLKLYVRFEGTENYRNLFVSEEAEKEKVHIQEMIDALKRAESDKNELLKFVTKYDIKAWKEKLYTVGDWGTEVIIGIDVDSGDVIIRTPTWCSRYRYDFSFDKYTLLYVLRALLFDACLDPFKFNKLRSTIDLSVLDPKRRTIEEVELGYYYRIERTYFEKVESEGWRKIVPAEEDVMLEAIVTLEI